MKPYYEHAGMTIYHGDCREVLQVIGGGVIISDPPYGIGFVYGDRLINPGAGNIPHASKFSGVKVIGDDEPFDPVHLLRFPSVLLWGANHYADRLPVRDGRWLVWDKRCGVSGERYLSDCEIAWVRGSGGKTARMFRHFWDGFNKQSERGIPRVHPTQKPLALATWCLGFLPEGRVIDPYMGSGTFLRAAKDAGRSAIGIEIEEKYCEIAAKRLSQEVFEFS